MVGAEALVDNEERYWFPAKTHGFGWGRPRTWQGWAVMAAYGLLLGLGMVLLKRNPAQAGLFLVYVLAVSVALVAVCLAKGEPPRWRWGKRK